MRKCQGRTCWTFEACHDSRICSPVSFLWVCCSQCMAAAQLTKESTTDTRAFHEKNRKVFSWALLEVLAIALCTDTSVNSPLAHDEVVHFGFWFFSQIGSVDAKSVHVILSFNGSISILQQGVYHNNKFYCFCTFLDCKFQFCLIKGGFLVTSAACDWHQAYMQY